MEQYNKAVDALRDSHVRELFEAEANESLRKPLSERLRAITCKTIPPEPGVVKTCHEAADEIEALNAACVAKNLRIRHKQEEIERLETSVRDLQHALTREKMLNAVLLECYTHLTYVADTEKALESIRKAEALLEEK